VYNRVSRGEHVFRREDEADRLEALLAATKKRDVNTPVPGCPITEREHGHG
jgi:hypothetical protein